MVPRDAIEFLGDVVLGSTLMLITFHGISGWGGHDPGPALPPSPKPEGGENGVLVGRGEGGSHLGAERRQEHNVGGLEIVNPSLCLNQVQLSSF